MEKWAFIVARWGISIWLLPPSCLLACLFAPETHTSSTCELGAGAEECFEGRLFIGWPWQRANINHIILQKRNFAKTELAPQHALITPLLCILFADSEVRRGKLDLAWSQRRERERETSRSRRTRKQKWCEHHKIRGEICGNPLPTLFADLYLILPSCRTEKGRTFILDQICHDLSHSVRKHAWKFFSNSLILLFPHLQICILISRRTVISLAVPSFTL